MFRLRFLRILLPLLLVLLAVLIWMSWEPRTGVRRAPAEVSGQEIPRAEGLSIKEFRGSSSAISGRVDVFEPGEDGRLHLEGIRQLEIEREDGGPLIVSALRGDREGEEGARLWRFDEEVVFHEADKGLRLSLPSLVIDEAAGEARSEGDIRFSAPDMEGRATALLYGLHGQPGELTQPEMRDSRDAILTAERARLLDGIRDVELLGSVDLVHTGRHLVAERLRLLRGRDDRLESAEADGGVVAEGPLGEGPAAEVSGDELQVRWNDANEVAWLRLNGDALVRHGDEIIAADSIESERVRDGFATWNVSAETGVFVQGRFGGSPGLLRAESVEAILDDTLELLYAEARDRVTFESRDTLAEAERATYDAAEAGGAIRLFGNDRRNARLAHGQTRVAARQILTDAHGNRMLAEDRVEATLLSGGGPDGKVKGNRLFVAEEAIHFVSRKLESENAGSMLVFTGAARGWQGERNLSAERVVVDQARNSLEARDNVTTRIPRESGTAAVAEDDYIQISAEALDYDDASGKAVYTGGVRVRLAEGWMEADRVEVLLAEETRQIGEIRAAGSVRLEVHRTSDEDMPRPFSGTADRLVYVPLDATLKLYGDDGPASVRRIGSGGGTTTGRVLTYHLDSGSLDVDSGGQGGRIRTGGG